MVRGRDDWEPNGEQLRNIEVTLVEDIVSKISFLVDDKSIRQWVPIGGVEDLAAGL